MFLERKRCRGSRHLISLARREYQLTSHCAKMDVDLRLQELEESLLVPAFKKSGLNPDKVPNNTDLNLKIGRFRSRETLS